MARRAAAALLCVSVALAGGERISAPRRGARPLPQWAARWPLGMVTMLCLAAAPPPPESRDLMAFEAMDANRDGIVDREEYMLSARDALDADQHSEKEIRRRAYEFIDSVYDVCDLDGDGVLNSRELEFGQYLAGLETGRLKHAKDTVPIPGPRDFGLETSERLHRTVDSDGSGLVDASEFGVLFRQSFVGGGWDEAEFGHPWLQGKVADMFAKADITGDGKLGVRELQYSAFLTNEFATDEMVVSLFQELDEDEDGRIALKEVAEAVERSKAMLARGEKSIVQVILSSFGDFDADHDGFLSYPEARSIARSLLDQMQGVRF